MVDWGKIVGHRGDLSSRRRVWRVCVGGEGVGSRRATVILMRREPVFFVVSIGLPAGQRPEPRAAAPPFRRDRWEWRRTHLPGGAAGLGPRGRWRLSSPLSNRGHYPSPWGTFFLNLDLSGALFLYLTSAGVLSLPLFLPCLYCSKNRVGGAGCFFFKGGPRGVWAHF